ncbi:NAD-dependent epimerase/dehydratase family protein [Melaminivora sp.]
MGVKIALTGGLGFLGRHVLAQLRARGCDVVLLGRSRPAEAGKATDGDWRAVDLLDTPHLQAALRGLGASHLLHLAWYTEHGRYWSSSENLRWVDASLQLLQAFAAQGGQHALLAGSCAEYDWSHGWLREATTPLQPASLYGVAKDATRRLAQAWCQAQGLGLAWAHVFYPFGPGEGERRLLPSLLRVFAGQAAPFGVNASAYRGLLPVQEAASALVHLLLTGQQGRYNICSGQPVPMGDVVRLLAHLCDADPEPVLQLATARPDEPPVLVGDPRRLHATGWLPSLTLQQGLEQLLAQPL